uniref:Uncharacterized protein n=1 Tax=Arundo donax TaxID=35708 RepID=A0A0A9BIT7_ARUDO
MREGNSYFPLPISLGLVNNVTVCCKHYCVQL